MIPKPSTCDGCPLQPLSSGFSHPDGTGSNHVLIVGEALGQREAEDGLPFRPKAAAGWVLEKAIRLSRMDRQQFALYNVVACRPPENKLAGESYEIGAIDHCQRHFRQVVTTFKPKVMLALGNTALRTLTGLTGVSRSVSALRGFPLENVLYPGIPVVSSYHPAFLQYSKAGVEKGGGGGGMSQFNVLCHDMRKAVLLAEKLTANPDYDWRLAETDYTTYPTVEEAKAFRDNCLNPDTLIAYDIETLGIKGKVAEDEYEKETGDTIIQIQFSIGRGTGIAFPYTGEYIDIAKQIMALSNPKVAHNCWLFDNPILRAHGFVINGTNYDTMTMWHHLQPDLPADLQFVASFSGFPFPWKHLAQTDLQTYGCCDVDALQYIFPNVQRDMKQWDIWESYERQVLRLQPVLQRMSDRGLPIDNIEREKQKAELDRSKLEILQDIQQHMPDELCNVDPKKGFVIGPKLKKGFIEEVGGGYRWWDSDNETWWPMIRREFIISIDIETGAEERVERWARRMPFLPNSPQQIKRYMKHRKHPIPRNLDGDETTAKVELNRMVIKTDDPVYSSIVEFREKTKIIGFLSALAPANDGRVHTEFTFRPATGQLSSRNPNIQNLAKRSDLAKALRRVVKASPGKVLIELDFKSFHALTLGYEARDPDYMRLARLDIHSFVTAHLIRARSKLAIAEAAPLKRITKERQEQLEEAIANLEWLADLDRWLELPDDQLAARLKDVKSRFRKVRDEQAKHAILGIGFGLGAHKLFTMNRDSFVSRADAQAVIDIIKRLFPKIFQYQMECRRLGASQHYIKTEYKYIRWFWEVVKWDAQKYMEVPGEDSEATVAFRPANNAFGMKKDAMLVIDETGLAEKYGLVNEIHDAFLFECDEALQEECIVEVKRVMEARSKVLVHPVSEGGLWCEVSASAGPSWAEMRDL